MKKLVLVILFLETFLFSKTYITPEHGYKCEYIGNSYGYSSYISLCGSETPASRYSDCYDMYNTNNISEVGGQYYHLVKNGTDSNGYIQFNKYVCYIDYTNPNIMIVNDPNFIQTYNADGSNTIQNNDGSIVTTNTDGSIHTINADGSERIYDSNGNLMLEKVTQPNGTIVSTYGDGKVEIEEPDGTSTSIHADGSAEVYFPNGDYIVVESDGTVNEYIQDSDTTTITYPDGTINKTLQDGQNITITTNPDGSKTHTIENGVTYIETTDGAFILDNGDGTTTQFNQDGSTEKKFNDGSSTYTSPTGIQIHTDSDGNQMNIGNSAPETMPFLSIDSIEDLPNTSPYKCSNNPYTCGTENEKYCCSDTQKPPCSVGLELINNTCIKKNNNCNDYIDKCIDSCGDIGVKWTPQCSNGEISSDCVCNSCNLNCASGFIPDYETCLCIPKEEQKCKKNFALVVDECVECEQKCPIGSEQIQNTCDCRRCPSTPPKGYKFAPESCDFIPEHWDGDFNHTKYNNDNNFTTAEPATDEQRGGDFNTTGLENKIDGLSNEMNISNMYNDEILGQLMGLNTEANKTNSLLTSLTKPDINDTLFLSGVFNVAENITDLKNNLNSELDPAKEGSLANIYNGAQSLLSGNFEMQNVSISSNPSCWNKTVGANTINLYNQFAPFAFKIKPIITLIFSIYFFIATIKIYMKIIETKE